MHDSTPEPDINEEKHTPQENEPQEGEFEQSQELANSTPVELEREEKHTLPQDTESGGNNEDVGDIAGAPPPSNDSVEDELPSNKTEEGNEQLDEQEKQPEDPQSTQAEKLDFDASSMPDADDSFEDNNATQQNRFLIGESIGRDKYVTGDIYAENFSMGSENNLATSGTLSQLEEKLELKYFQTHWESRQHAEIRQTNIKQNNRFLIVLGQDSAYSFSTCVSFGKNYALANPDLKSISVYTPSNIEKLSLLRFVKSDEVPENSILILENIFSRTFSITLVNQRTVEAINQILKKKNSLLLISTKQAESAFPDINPLLLINSNNLNFEKILVKHLEYYETHKGYRLSNQVKQVVIETNSNYVNRFQSVTQIDQFCLKVCEINVDSKAQIEHVKSQIDFLANHISNLRQDDLNSWFINLSLNEKFYALLVYCFPSLSSTFLNNLYQQCVQYLRHDGVGKLDDPREQGTIEILSRIHAVITPYQRIEFTNKDYEEEVSRQVESYFLFLWSISSILFKYTEELKNAFFWETRQAIGSGIARIGKANEAELVVLLLKFGTHSERGVRVLPGYTLAELCKEEKYWDFAYELLRSWVNSNDPVLPWTVAATVLRVVESVNNVGREQNFENDAKDNAIEYSKKLLALFTNILRKNPDDEIKSSISFTLNQLSHSNPELVVYIIQQWFDEDDTLATHAENFCAYILIYLKEFVECFPDIHFPILKLSTPLLQKNQPLVKLYMELLRDWAENPDWHKYLYHYLISLCANLTESEYWILQAAIIDSFLQNASAATVDIGTTILRIATLLQGLFVDCPEGETILLLIDNSNRARRYALNLELIHSLYGYSWGWSIPSARQMGAREELLGSSPNEIIDLNRNYPYYPSPPLVVPSLEEATDYQNKFIIFASWLPIIDFEDLSKNENLPNYFNVVVNHSPRWLFSQSEFLNLPRDDGKILLPANIRKLRTPSSFRSYVSVIEDIHKQFTLSRLQSIRGWESYLTQQFKEDLSDAETIIQFLNSSINNINQTWLSKEDTHTIHLSISTINWLSYQNLSICVENLCQWATSESQLKRLIARASSANLLTIHSAELNETKIETVIKLLPLFDLLKDSNNWSHIKLLINTLVLWLQDKTLSPLFHSSDADAYQTIITLSRSNNIAQNFQFQTQGLLATLRASQQAKNFSNGVEQSNDSTFLETILDRLSLNIALNEDSIGLQNIQDLDDLYIIVFDKLDSSENGKFTYLELAFQIEKLLNREYTNSTTILKFQLGSRYPFSNYSEDIESIIVPNFNNPRLLAPILDLLPYNKVKTIYLVTENEIVDEGDWLHLWEEKINMFSFQPHMLTELEYIQMDEDVFKDSKKLKNLLKI